MEQNTKELIETLAAKLGTTTEYLWSVLIKQAPIDATVTLIQIILTGIFGYILLKLHRKFSKEIDNYSFYDNNDWAIIPMVLSAIIFGLLAIISFFCIGDVFNGYFNPEYWALKQVFNFVK